MSLSDLFKKSPKKQPAQEKPDNSPEMQKKRYDAAMEFIQNFQERMPLVDGKPHAGTVLSVAGRLAGTSLFRSLNKQEITPGVVVLSEEVNQAYPHLLNLFAHYCKKSGIDVMSRPPVTEFPENNKPLMQTDQVLAEYQDQYHEIMKRHGLDYLEGARAGMIVCSTIFQYHAMKVKDIDPFVAAGIVAMGVVEGAKTAPPPFDTSNTHIPKNNNRLVLGEDKIAAKEARENGGVFIQLPRTALQTLQGAKIDPYVIYEKGLLDQIEAKIQRIDFVEANVDDLFNQWQSKPEKQIPIYIRLLIWLKNNASAHHYEQSGNSWLLQK